MPSSLTAAPPGDAAPAKGSILLTLAAAFSTLDAYFWGNKTFLIPSIIYLAMDFSDLGLDDYGLNALSIVRSAVPLLAAQAPLLTALSSWRPAPPPTHAPR